MGKVKGAHVAKAIKMLRSYRASALRLLPRNLHPYLDKRILDTSWYDESDCLEILGVVAQLLAENKMVPPGMDPWEAIGRDAAAQDAKGVYRSILKPGDPERTLRRSRTFGSCTGTPARSLSNATGLGTVSWSSATAASPPRSGAACCAVTPRASSRSAAPPASRCGRSSARPEATHSAGERSPGTSCPRRRGRPSSRSSGKGCQGAREESPSGGALSDRRRALARRLMLRRYTPPAQPRIPSASRAVLG